MKKTTKKSPTGAPLGNPLKFFREGGEKIKTMFKTGGYNTPTQSLPKANKGRAMRDMDKYLYPEPVGRERGDGPSYNPYISKPNYGPMTEEESMKANFPNGPTVMNTPSSSRRGMANATIKQPRPIVDPMRVVPNPGSGDNGNGFGYGNTTMKHVPNYIPEEKNGGMMKKGGATKAKKFAALAPPFNKATAADRIAGAKKNVRKKK